MKLSEYFSGGRSPGISPFRLLGNGSVFEVVEMGGEFQDFSGKYLPSLSLENMQNISFSFENGIKTLNFILFMFFLRNFVCLI